MRDISKNISRYIEFARICRAVYPGPTNHTYLTTSGVQFSSQRYIHGSFGRGFSRIFWNDDTVVVAFRGTREIIFDFLISNLAAYPVRLRDCGEDGARAKVHAGFQRTLDFVDKSTQMKGLEAIFHRLSESKLLDRRMFIIGHSLGGALAKVFAVKLCYRFPQARESLQEIVTFGAPAIGGNSFYDFYGGLHEKTTRFVNGSDWVPFTPPFGYRHVGHDVWLHEVGFEANVPWKTRLKRSTLSRLFSDHSISLYRERLTGLQKLSATIGKNR